MINTTVRPWARKTAMVFAAAIAIAMLPVGVANATQPSPGTFHTTGYGFGQTESLNNAVANAKAEAQAAGYNPNTCSQYARPGFVQYGGGSGSTPWNSWTQAFVFMHCSV